jgi:hypothetical protein
MKQASCAPGARLIRLIAASAPEWLPFCDQLQSLAVGSCPDRQCHSPPPPHIPLPVYPPPSPSHVVIVASVLLWLLLLLVMLRGGFALGVSRPAMQFMTGGGAGEHLFIHLFWLSCVSSSSILWCPRVYMHLGGQAYTMRPQHQSRQTRSVTSQRPGACPR